MNFPKLADWAVHGRPSFVAAVGAGIFKQGTFLLHHPVVGGEHDVVRSIGTMATVLSRLSPIHTTAALSPSPWPELAEGDHI